ncbi:Putative glutamine amidotransferase [bacterium HR39]|nr:Putative glutamine amidotransferase [bacterium HR39]
MLAICGGMQLLNVVLGGTLLQHIPDAVPGALAHEQPHPRTEPGHEVEITPESRLHGITGRLRMAVNSAHHQAVDRPGRDLLVSARAPDGVVEAVEHRHHPFVIGVQWHPEYGIDPGDRRLFEGLVAAARGCAP